MAERRMFSKTIIDSDAFLDMPMSSQALYFHLAMRADDDGFVNNPSKITRMVGANKNDFDLLMVKNFLIPFENGVCVIKHWLIHNYIQKDRYKPTNYIEEKKRLQIKDNKAYILAVDTECIQDVSKMDSQVRLGKERLGKVSIEKRENKINQDINNLDINVTPSFEITDIFPELFVDACYLYSESEYKTLRKKYEESTFLQQTVTTLSRLHTLADKILKDEYKDFKKAKAAQSDKSISKQTYTKEQRKCNYLEFD